MTTFILKHDIAIHYSKTLVANIFNLPVSQSQLPKGLSLQNLKKKKLFKTFLLPKSTFKHISILNIVNIGKYRTPELKNR